MNKMTSRDRFLLIFLAVLLIGVCYYMFFFKPLQAELDSVANQCTETDQAIQVSMAKAKTMKTMQDELDEIFSRPADQITEIAPYDNAKVVMSQLNGILSATSNYDLKFHDPKIEDDGTVRRTVSMTFDCENYQNARLMIEALSASHWRCLINGISIKAQEEQYIPAAEEEVAEGTAEAPVEAPVVEAAPVENEVMRGAVSVTATITFFESTKIS